MWDWLDSLKIFYENYQAGTLPELGAWSYILLGLLVATEGPLSTLIGATASAAGMLDWRWVLTATIVGNVVGDCVWYSVGYAGKMKWLYDHGRWFGMRPHHVARLEREMRAHAQLLIIFAKIAYGLIVPTLVAAGMARVPWRKWFPVVFLVETIWSVVLVWIGFHTTAYIQDFEHALHALGVAVLVGVAIFAVMRFLRKRIDQRELALDPLAQQVAQQMTVSGVLPAEGTDCGALVRPEIDAANPASAVELRTDRPPYEAQQGDVQRYMALPERERDAVG